MLFAGFSPSPAASELLRPYDARLMRCYPVSTMCSSIGDSVLFEESFDRAVAVGPHNDELGVCRCRLIG